MYNKSSACLTSFLLAFILICHSNLLAEERSKASIGVILALSGPLAEVGESIKNSILLAQENYDGEKKVKIIFEDDEFKTKNSVTAANKLINIDKVDSLITFSGGTSNAVASIAEKNKIPMLGITALSSIGIDRKYVFSLFLSKQGQIDILAQAAKKTKLKRLSIITSTQEALIFLKDELIKKIPGKIISSDEVIPGDINLNSLASKVRLENPDGIFLFLLPPQISLFSKQLRQQGYRGKFLGGPPIFNPSEIKAANGALTKAWFPGPESTYLSEYLSNYEDKYSKLPISEGLYAYESAHLLIKAIFSKNLIGYLSNLKQFSGIAGSYYKNSDNAFQIPVELREISETGEVLRVDL